MQSGLWVAFFIAYDAAMKPIAIVGAIHEELASLLAQLVNRRKLLRGGREFWLGSLHGRELVLVLSGLGKVAAATTASVLIERLDVQAMLFTGLAGGLGQGVRVGDVVVASSFVQHDMDVTPLFPRYEVPLYGRASFATDPQLSGQLVRACQQALADPLALLGSEALAEFSLTAACVHQGLIASGDQFIASASQSTAIQAGLRAQGCEALAVEMEGAAVAQVCFDYGVPFAAVRTISDRADEAAHVDFKRFLHAVASRYSAAIMTHFLQT